MEIVAALGDVRAGLLCHDNLCSYYSSGSRRRHLFVVLLPPLSLERHLVRVEPRARSAVLTWSNTFSTGNSILQFSLILRDNSKCQCHKKSISTSHSEEILNELRSHITKDEPVGQRAVLDDVGDPRGPAVRRAILVSARRVGMRQR